MNRIFVITGKSSSGKDSIFRELIKDDDKDLKKYIPYTTRPERRGECDGVEYRFSDEKTFSELKAAGRIIEEGTHDELLAKQGRYYELYETQAKYYRDNNELQKEEVSGDEI